MNNLGGWFRAPRQYPGRLSEHSSNMQVLLRQRERVTQLILHPLLAAQQNRTVPCLLLIWLGRWLMLGLVIFA